MAKLPSSASVVVVGGGILGVATAYQLARAGKENVVLLERRQLACGTTWHSVGSVGQVRGNEFLTSLAVATARMLQEVEAETGLDTGYKKTGSIMVALNEERLMEMQRTVAAAKLYGLDARMMSREEVAERAPYVSLDGVLAGMYLPDDGGTNAVDTVNALARAARSRGAVIVEGVEVLDFLRSGNRVAGVSTAQGEISADKVVLCTGIWSRDLAAKAGVAIPLAAAEHFYAVTEPIAEIDPKMPMIRVPDERTYYKNDAGKLLFGCFEAMAKPWGLDGIPEDFCFDSLPEDIDHFEPILIRACQRMPMLNTAGIQLFFNGPEAFTPDGEFHIGEAPELQGLYAAAGMNSVGVMTSGGVSRLIARIVLGDAQALDYSDHDLARAQFFQVNKDYLRERTIESVGVLYGLQTPGRQFDRARDIRRSPVHEQHLAAGACMESHAGWERPAVFAPDGTEPRLIESYLAPNWLPWALDECRVLEGGEALVDSTMSAKFEVPLTRESRNFLERLTPIGDPGCANLRAALSEHGRLELVFSAVEIGCDRALLIADARDQRSLRRLLRDRLPGLPVFDATSAYTIFDIVGLSLTSKSGGPHAGSRSGCLHSELIDIGWTRAYCLPYADWGCRFQRLIVPSEYGSGLWHALTEAHPQAVRVGARALAMHAARRGCPRWRRDYGPGELPHQALPDAEGSTLRRLKVNKASFPIWGGEPVMSNGLGIGVVTSAGPGVSTGSWSLLARLRPGHGLDRDEVSILLGSETLPARLVAQ